MKFTWILFYIFCFVLGVASASLLFPISYPSTFYVEPVNGQYTVTLNVIAGRNVQMVRPMSFQKATELANTLNGDMNGKWAHQPGGGQ